MLVRSQSFLVAQVFICPKVLKIIGVVRVYFSRLDDQLAASSILLGIAWRQGNRCNAPHAVISSKIQVYFLTVFVVSIIVIINGLVQRVVDGLPETQTPL